MIKLANELKQVKSVMIAGHVRPDGDSTGACLAVYSYVKEWFPELEAAVFLEEKNPVFASLAGFEEIQTECPADRKYDLFLSLDASDKERLGKALACFEAAEHTVCIDHHITNVGFAEKNWIEPAASSTSELVFEAMEEERISKATAEALYTGIIHDTGIFQYSNTSPRTMEIAGKLIGKGIAFSRIIDETFYQKTYVQNQVLGRTLMESILLLDGRVIMGRLRQKEMEFYGVGPKDLEGIVNQLRVTKGVEVAIFLHEIGNQEYKVSLRSNGPVDVSEICKYFGGGGHVKAAGCTMHGTLHDVVNNLTLHIDRQLQTEE